MKVNKEKIIIFIFTVAAVLFLYPKVTLAAPQITVNNTSQGYDFRTAAYGNNIYIAVGEGGYVERSTDGLNWSRVIDSTIASHDLTSIAYGDNTFVVSGEKGEIFTSTDGITWTARSSGVSSYLSRIIYTGSTFYIVGQNDTVLTSTDSITWTKVNIGTSGKYFGTVAYGNNTIVLGDTEGDIYYSTNGTSWNQVKLSNYYFSSNVNFIRYMNGKFYASNANAALYTSTDGGTWTSVGAPFRVEGTNGGCDQAFSALWDGTNYYFFGNANGSYGGLVKSPTGTSSFADSSTISTMVVSDSLYANGVYIQVCQDGLLVSTDGSNWTCPVGFGNFNSFAYDESKYLAAGSVDEDGAIYSSTDFKTWSLVSRDESMKNVTLSSIAYGSNKYIAVGYLNSDYSSKAYKSSDGVSWAPMDTLNYGTLTSVTYGNNSFVSVSGNGDLITSTDGSNWTSHYNDGTGNTYFNSVAFVNGKFIACGNGGKIFYSIDGTSWTDMSYSDDTVSFYGVAYSGGKYVFVGGDSNWKAFTISSSDDLSTYNLPSKQVSGLSTLMGVTYGDGMFMAITNDSNSPQDGYIVTSADGDSWTNTDTNNTPYLAGISYINNKFRIPGTNNLAMSVSNPISNLATSSETGTTADLSFSAATGATSVVVKYSTDGGFTWNNAATSVALDENSTSATVTGLTGNTSYKFKLVVTDGSKEGDSNVIDVTTSGAFASETDSTTSNEPATLGITGTTATSSSNSIATAAINASTGKIDITSVAAGNATINVSDAEGHAATISVKVADSGAITINSITKAAPISDLASASKTDVTADLSFSAATGAASVVVKYSTDNGSTWNTAATSAGLDQNSTSATVTGLTVGTSYKLKLVITGGSSVGDSNVIDVTTNAATNAAAPSITSDLSTQEVTYTNGANASSLSVTAANSDTGTLSYKWYSNTTGIADPTSDTAITGAASASYTPSTTTNGTTYYYCVVTNTNDSVNGTKTAAVTSKVAKITVNAAIPNNSSLTTNTASFDKNFNNEQDVIVSMNLNGNTLTNITNGLDVLVNGTDYVVSGDTVEINELYFRHLNIGSTTLTFNFSAGNSQNLSVTIIDTTPVAASGLTVTTAAETPAVSGKVNLTVTPGATDGSHKVYYKIVDSDPTALNIGDVIISSEWTAVTDANAHEITVANGKYIEAVEVTTADNKVTNWGKSGATADGYVAPVSSSLSANTVNFDKNTANQADVSIGVTLNGNTLAGITNGNYTLLKGTDYTLNVDTVTINKRYLASLGTGTAALVFNFSAGSSQNLSVIISDSTPGNASLSTNTASFDKNTANQADVNVGMTISQNTLTGITSTGTSLAQGTDYTISGNTVSIKKSSLGKLSTGTSTVLFNSSTGNSQNLTAAISVDQTGVNFTMALNGHELTSITNDGNTLVNGTDYIVNGNTVTIKRGFLTKLGTGIANLVFNFETEKLAVTVSEDEANVNVTMAVNENALTSITNGNYTLVNGTDYTVNGNAVTIKKSYLGTLSTGTSALAFNFSEGSPQTLNVAISDTTAIAASGLTVTTAAENPAVSGKVNLTVTPGAEDSNHKVYYRIVNADPSALNVGYVITTSEWTEVTNANAHEITVPNGKYIETVEVTTTDNKVTKWGKSGITVDGYIAPVSSSLSINTANFDKNTSNQADVNVGMTLNGNILTSITNGTYALVKGTDYAVNGNTVTINKSYLASLSAGTAALVFNFSAGNPQNLNISITDATSYTVTFKDYNGNTIGIPQTVNYGENATAPGNPTRTGYTFTGWDKAFVNVTGNLVVTAQYSINKYTVTFKDYDGSTIGAPQTVNYGGNASAPANPTRTGYVFAGWDKAFDNVTGNLVLTATYTSGNTYDFPSNTSSSTGGDETKIPTDYLKSRDNTLVINNSTADLSIPASAIDLTDGADHIKVTEKVVTSTSANNTLGLFSNVPNGVQMVGNPLSLNIQLFDANDNLIKDIHNFSNNQKVKVTIKLTAAQIAGADTSKLSMYYYDETTNAWVELGGSFDPGTMEFTFYTPHFTNFAIMDKVSTPIPTPTPVPTPTVTSYTVTFKDYDGSTIGTPQTVNYGGSATAPAAPTRTGYVFAGWNKTFDKVTGDLVVTATYTSENTYKLPSQTLVITNNKVEISIPAGSIEATDGAEYIKVTEKVDNNVEEEFGSVPNGLKIVGNPLLLSIQLFDANNNYIKDVHKLANNEKIKVTMKFTGDELKGVISSGLTMYHYDEEAKAWTKLEGSFDPSTMEMTFYMTEL